MPEDLKVDELHEQLRSYGNWLEQRSDVTLSNADRFIGDGGFGGAADQEPSRPSGGRLLIVAGAMVLIAGAAILAVANRGEPSGSVTAADGDELTTEAATTEADVETGPDVNGPRSVLDVPAAQGGTDDGSTDGATPNADAVTDGGDAMERGSVKIGDGGDVQNDGGTQSNSNSNSNSKADANSEAEAAGDASSAGSIPSSNPNSQTSTSTTSTTKPATPSTVDTETTRVAPNPSGDSMTFIAPRHGDGVDINLGTTFRVASVDGASAYTFIATQKGAEAFRLTVDRPTFVLPGQLTAFTDGWLLEAGLMSVTVVASNSSGTELASQTIDVVLRPGGGTPRRGLPGQILPTIPDY